MKFSINPNVAADVFTNRAGVSDKLFVLPVSFDFFESNLGSHGLRPKAHERRPSERLRRSSSAAEPRSWGRSEELEERRHERSGSAYAETVQSEVAAELYEKYLMNLRSFSYQGLSTRLMLWNQ